MTLYLNMRQGAVGGALVEPYLLSGDGMGPKPALRALDNRAAAELVQGRTVVFAVHGFNVSYEKGVRSLAKLERAMALPADHVVMGVLWPGDYWIPAINYPVEWQDAVRGGQALARYADTVLKGAQGFSFFSHSLGGRLTLEAAAHLRRRLVRVCLAAPATDDDC
ncbi:MAG: alpha/beta hydrolase, partial [Phenylobacterium sp.]